MSWREYCLPPVKYIGVGESVDDLERFDPDDFCEALFEEKEVKKEV